MSEGFLSAIGMTIALSVGVLTGSEPRAPQPVLSTPDLQLPADPRRTIERSADGLFYVEARLNGVPVRFAVDTGANVTILCAADARRAGLTEKLTYDETILTGGGHVSTARTKVANLSVMSVDFADVPIVIGREPFPISILGHDLLRRMGPILIDGDKMTLGPTMSALTMARS